jgi:hypothetical protein
VLAIPALLFAFFLYLYYTIFVFLFPLFLGFNTLNFSFLKKKLVAKMATKKEPFSSVHLQVFFILLLNYLGDKIVPYLFSPNL